MKREISYFGVLLTLLALFAFSFLAFKIVGWWAILAGPIITIAAARPARGGGTWLWEKKDKG